MELRLLRNFLVLAEELHFGRAAERLHLSQPPLTKQIQQLEAELNVGLFDRSKRSVRLTAAGQTLVREAQRLLSQTDQAIRAVQRTDSGDIGQVKIAFIASAIYMGVDSLFRRVEKVLPGISTVWEEMSSFEQLEAVQHGRIDLGFVQTLPNLEGMSGTVVFDVPLVVALPADHPLAKYKTIPLARLHAEPFIMVSREYNPGFHDLVTSACLQAGFSPHILHHVRQQLTVVNLVAMGRGVSLVPQSLALAAFPGVALRPVRGQRVRADYSVIWNPANTLPILPRVLEILIDASHGRQTRNPLLR